jgi:mono/diheme cytochrome c family protein
MRARAVTAGLLVVLSAASPAAEPPAGAASWAVHCAPCHGATARGDGPDAPLFLPRPRNLRDGLLERHGTEALVRTVRDGAPLSLALDVAALRARGGDVETILGHVRRLPDLDWARIERGEDLFLARCARCHGHAGRPADAVLAPGAATRDLGDPAAQRATSDEALRERVQHARPGMPATEVADLVAFVRVLSPGFVLYGRYCASCHGRDGRGDDLVDPGRAPRVVFDRAYFTARSTDAVRARVWHMLAEQRPAMPHFRRRLSEPEVRAIVAWLSETD